MTIVEYTDRKPAVNAYPRRIISPPTRRSCCPDAMEPIGRPQADRPGWQFVYMRCRQCGFTVRRFLAAENLDAKLDPFRDDAFGDLEELLWPHPLRPYPCQSTSLGFE